MDVQSTLEHCPVSHCTMSINVIATYASTHLDLHPFTNNLCSTSMVWNGPVPLLSSCSSPCTLTALSCSICPISLAYQPCTTHIMEIAQFIELSRSIYYTYITTLILSILFIPTECDFEKGKNERRLSKWNIITHYY